MSYTFYKEVSTEHCQLPIPHDNPHLGMHAEAVVVSLSGRGDGMHACLRIMPPDP
jgi:hypothetical protein